MTYSLTEKEEILYEREIEELFTLTEKPIKYATLPEYNNPIELFFICLIIFR